MSIRESARKLHESVNHRYGNEPYVYHLDMVRDVFVQFYDEAPVLPEKVNGYRDEIYLEACYFHDSIEDCRMTPNDLIKYGLLHYSVEIIFALTNEKGWSRAERANEKYYAGIRNKEGAGFVKMCDRIANVRYSKIVGSSMLDKYRKENDKFMEAVEAHRYPEMQKCLIKLFE